MDADTTAAIEVTVGIADMPTTGSDLAIVSMDSGAVTVDMDMGTMVKHHLRPQVREGSGVDEGSSSRIEVPTAFGHRHLRSIE